MTRRCSTKHPGKMLSKHPGEVLDKHPGEVLGKCWWLRAMSCARALQDMWL